MRTWAAAAAALLAAGGLSACGGGAAATDPPTATAARAASAAAPVTTAAARGRLPSRARLRAGGKVTLGARRYGAVDLHGLRPARPLVLVGAGPATRLGAVDLDGARDVTVTRVAIGGGVHVGAGARAIALRDSSVTRRGIVVRRAKDIIIDDVRVHDVALLGHGEGDGFGLWVRGQGDGGPDTVAQDLKVSRSCFAHLPDDGIHLSAVAGVTVTASEFTDIFPSVDPAVHADSIQVQDTARDVAVRGSWFHDTNRGIIVKDDIYPRFAFRANVFEKLKAWAFDLYDTPGVRIADNVVRDQPGSSLLLHEQHGQMRDAVVTGNQLLRWSFARDQVARESGNRIAEPAAASPYAVDDVLGMPPPAAAVPRAMRACATAPA